MDSEEAGGKEFLSRKYIVGITLALLILVFSLLFVFRDFDEASEEAGPGLEETQEEETQTEEDLSLSEYFEKEFAEEKEAQNVGERELFSEDTCLLDGQSVKEGTIVSGTTCSGPSEE